METATELATLTADDIKALKAADDVTFHTTVGESSVIRAHKRAKLNDGWASNESYYDINVSDSWVDYGRSYGSNGPGEYKYAFASVSSFDEVWHTIASLLRVGDSLWLHWVVDNNSETIEKAGLHSDELRLVVKRANAKQALVFTVDTSICPDNSARMVRRTRWG